MDLVFQLSNGDQATYLINLMHSCASSYICLWTYSPENNILYCKQGYYQEESSSQLVARSSPGSITRRLFDDYKESVFTVGNDFVPGLAFKHRNPYLELQELDLQRLGSLDSQRQFYREARIKIAVFLGCSRGEIELGLSSIPQMSLEMEMQSFFPQDFARQQSSVMMDLAAQQQQPQQQRQQPQDPQQKQQQQQSLPSPSSSFSMDSPEYSSLFYTIPTSSPYLQEHSTTRAQTIPIVSTTHGSRNQLPTSLSALSQLQNSPFPTPESTDDALTRAYLAILSSPNSSSSTPTQQAAESRSQKRKSSAFKSYVGGLGPSASGSHQMRSSDHLRRQTMLKRAIAYFRGVNYTRMQALQGSHPTSNQLHHMISERRRREKINESFQALRSLLPQGTKKDKASVLRTTKEYLSSLKSQLSDLSKRNQILEEQLLPKKESTASKQQLFTNERLNVRVTMVSESTSEQRIVDLQVMLRGSNRPAMDVLIRVLEFLKQVKEVSLVSMDAQSSHQETAGANHQSPTNWSTFRLRIEGPEWDESTFKEAVRRVLADLAQ